MVFDSIFLAGFSICYGMIRICGIRVISNIYLKSAVGLGLLALSCVSVTLFFRDTWIFLWLLRLYVLAEGDLLEKYS